MKSAAPYLLLLLLTPCLADAQSVESKPAAAPKTYYRAPKSYSTTRDPDVPKYAKHAQDTNVDFLKDADWLDLGADYRLRAEYRDDDIRRPVAVVDEPFLQRTRAYIGIHDVLDPFRFAFEMQDSRVYNGDFEPDNRDVNEAAIIRLQAELYFKDALGTDPLGNDRPVSLRYGIQNFEFLDRRLLGNNQWRNTANTFLGFRGALGQDANDWSVDLLAVQPLEREKYDWDDPVDGRWIYGVIGHWRGWSDFLTVEPFYLGLDQKENATTVDRYVHSPGLRLYGTIADTGLDFDVSGVRQTGHNGTRDVDAWGATGEIGYSIDSPWKPRISAFYGFASGDRDPNDAFDNRFERFYGFGRPWSANDYIVYENIRTPKLRVELTPGKKFRMDFGYSWYALASATDRFPAADNARDITGSSGNNVGHEFDIRGRWQVTKQFEAILGYAHFQPGDFTNAVLRPEDTDFAYLELNLVAF